MTSLPEAPETYIAHRAPILCLDEILDAAEETRVVCGGTVRDGPHVRDGRMWEGGLIEGLAQAAGVMNGRYLHRRNRFLRVGMLVALKRFRVFRCPKIGESVRYEVAVARRLVPLTLINARALAGDEVLAEGLMKFYEESGP